MTYDLRPPATQSEWAAYHEIRRRVLFELRGNGDAYDPNHPDDSQPSHHPLVLWRDGESLGVIRVDIDSQSAAFRRVAIREGIQRRGHGRQLIAAAESFAQVRGCTRVESHVDLDAVGFYERCGYAIPEDVRPGPASVLMTKTLNSFP